MKIVLRLRKSLRQAVERSRKIEEKIAKKEVFHSSIAEKQSFRFTFLPKASVRIPYDDFNVGLSLVFVVDSCGARIV